MVGEDTVEGEAEDQTRLDFAFVFLHVVVVIVAEAERVLGHHEPLLVRIIIGGGSNLDSAAAYYDPQLSSTHPVNKPNH